MHLTQTLALLALFTAVAFQISDSAEAMMKKKGKGHGKKPKTYPTYTAACNGTIIPVASGYKVSKMTFEAQWTWNSMSDTYDLTTEAGFTATKNNAAYNAFTSPGLYFWSREFGFFLAFG